LRLQTRELLTKLETRKRNRKAAVEAKRILRLRPFKPHLQALPNFFEADGDLVEFQIKSDNTAALLAKMEKKFHRELKKKNLRIS
jgi:hypothetical protein